jgi:hypothetical protein
VATTKLRITDMRKMPNLAEPQAGTTHTIIVYTDESKDEKGNLNAFVTFIGVYPPQSIHDVFHHVKTDYKKRKELVGQIIDYTD